MKNCGCAGMCGKIVRKRRRSGRMSGRTVRVAATLMAALICAMMASAAGAQKCSVKPVAISLGQTVRVSCQIAASSARLNGRTVPMFRQTNGSWFGLMPVAVADVPGTYSVEFLGEDGGAVSVREADDSRYEVSNAKCGAGAADRSAAFDAGRH